MMEQIIKNELQKNNVRDNYSGKFDKITYTHFSGEKKIKLNTKLNGIYGYICVSVDNASDFKIGVNGVIIYKADSKDSTIIPIRFFMGDYVELFGQCDNLKILISGAEFEYFEKDFVMCGGAKYIADCGGTKRIYSFDKLKNGRDDYSLESEIECLEILDFKYNNLNHIATIIEENRNAYLCTNIDNYSMKKMIDFDYDNLILINGIGDNILGLLYNLDNSLCVRWVDSSLNLSSVNVIENVAYGITDIINVRVDDGSITFAITLNNGNVVLYFYDTKFLKIFTTKSRKGKFCIVDKKIYYIYHNGYGVAVKVYAFNSDNSSIVITNSIFIDVADNAIVDSSGILLEYNLIERFVSFDEL